MAENMFVLLVYIVGVTPTLYAWYTLDPLSQYRVRRVGTWLSAPFKFFYSRFRLS